MIDLQFNYPSVPTEATLLHEYMTQLPPAELRALLAYPPVQGSLGCPEALGGLLGVNWQELSMTTDLVICNSANHALTCILQSLRSAYSKIIAEAFTFTAFKMIAQDQVYELLPASMDNEGATVESIAAFVQSAGARLLYLQPTIQNPTCTVMSLERRLELVALAREKDLLIIEDDAYRFLHPSPPPSFWELAPERTIHVFSLSKPFNPLAKVAFVLTPKSLTPGIIEQVRLTSSGASSLLVHFANHLLTTGALTAVMEQKRQEASRRQQLAQQILGALPYYTTATSFHLWLPLPAGTMAQQVVGSLYSQGVKVASGADFSTVSSQGSSHIRIALGAENDTARLMQALHLVYEALSSISVHSCSL